MDIHLYIQKKFSNEFALSHSIQNQAYLDFGLKLLRHGNWASLEYLFDPLVVGTIGIPLDQWTIIQPNLNVVIRCTKK